MAITVVGSSALGGSAVNGGNVTLTWPTLAQDDYCVVVSEYNNGTGAASMSTSGYSLLGSVANVLVWGKRQGGSPDANVVVNGTGNASRAHAVAGCVFRGVDTTTAIDATVTTANGASTNPDPPSTGTSVADGAMVVVVAGSAVDDVAITPPSGYTNGASGDASDTISATAAIASKLISPSATENPASWTNWSSGTWGAITIALRPAVTASVMAQSPLLLCYP